MHRVPKNVQCDSRLTCAVSINGKGCIKEDKMADITDDWKPEQVCGEVSYLFLYQGRGDLHRQIQVKAKLRLHLGQLILLKKS